MSIFRILIPVTVFISAVLGPLQGKSFNKLIAGANNALMIQQTIEEKDIDVDSFRKTVNELMADPGRLEQMGQKAHELAARSASDIIYEETVKDLWKKANV